jgi:hypothetical protein
MSTPQPAMTTARAEGQRQLELAEHTANRADASFGDLTRDFILQYLRAHGPTSGEVITNAAKRSGIRPKDDRAFGGPYNSLQKRGLIMVDGMVTRFKGHGSGGARIWRLTRKGGDANGSC